MSPVTHVQKPQVVFWIFAAVLFAAPAECRLTAAKGLADDYSEYKNSIMLRVTDWRALSWVIAALAIYASARLLPASAGLSVTGQAVLGVVFAGVVLWVSEAVPLGLAALVET